MSNPGRRRPEPVEFDADHICGETHRTAGWQSATPGLVVFHDGPSNNPCGSHPDDEQWHIWSTHGNHETLHRADRAAVVRAALEEAGIDSDDHDELAVSGTDGRWEWEILPRSRVDERTYAAAIAEAIATQQRWREEYETAMARSGPSPPASVA
jgi:hypothetical protein